MSFNFCTKIYGRFFWKELLEIRTMMKRKMLSKSNEIGNSSIENLRNDRNLR